LAVLSDQLKGLRSDPELSRLEVLGWFVAHTRTSLVMTDAEAAIFDRFFPGAGKITMLVKPQRFQPTRFGFVYRDLSGNVERDATQTALILPLSGRGKGGLAAASPSIAAPVDAEPAPAAPMSTVAEPPLGPKYPLASPPAAEAQSQTVVHELATPSARSVPEPAAESAPVSPARNADAYETSATPQVNQPVTALQRLPPRDRSLETSLPSIDDIRKRRGQKMPDGRASVSRKGNEDLTRAQRLRLSFVLIMAAVLGCAAGYLAYVQLPPAIIPLRVESRPPNLIVFWPPEQTRDSVYAALRVGNGDPITLTREQKAAGYVLIVPTGNDTKIELIAQHSFRDSRGIVRYIKNPRNAALVPSEIPTAPMTQPR
jgi:hypothetical protein